MSDGSEICPNCLQPYQYFASTFEAFGKVWNNKLGKCEICGTTFDNVVEPEYFKLKQIEEERRWYVHLFDSDGLPRNDEFPAWMGYDNLDAARREAKGFVDEGHAHHCEIREMVRS